jgi:hypothetical protein
VLTTFRYRCGTDILQIQVWYFIPSVTGVILIDIGYRCGAQYLQIHVWYGTDNLQKFRYR